MRTRLLAFRWSLTDLALAVVVGSLGCATAGTSPTVPPVAVRIQLTSPAFTTSGALPTEYTCDGPDRSPPLSWSEPPPGTAAFVLVVEDPDAPGGTFTHWLLYDLPAATRSLPPAVPPDETLQSGARQGRNDFGTVGYRGPCPPPGRPHRYVFRLYALDRPTGLPPGAQRNEILRALEGHILAIGELVGTYGREPVR